MGEQMSETNKDGGGERECGCKENEECSCVGFDVVELEDENGDIEEFAILEELDFEGRRFVILAPLAELQAHLEKESEETGENSPDFDIVIYEEDGENFNFVEDPELSKRIMDHADKLSQEHS
jgi:hypothetical protein